MQIRAYVALLRRWLWLLLAAVTLAGLAAFVGSRLQTPVYQGTATILVNQAAGLGAPTYNDILANQQLSKTYASLVTSGPVLARVGERFDLPEDQLRRTVSATARLDEQIIDISARSTDRELAAELANETARVFAEQIRTAQLSPQFNVEEDLRAEVAEIQRDIDSRVDLVRRLSTPQQGVTEDQRLQQLALAQSQAESLRQRLASTQRRLQDLRIEVARSINSVSLVDPARAPTKPASPRILLNTALGAIFGLLLAAGIIAIAENLDDSLKTAAAVRRVTWAPILGTISRFGPRAWPLLRGRGGAVPLLTALDSRSPIQDEYRIIRTNLEFARGDRPNLTMLISSVQGGEGKSVTAANLALVLAQAGQRVILVDTDLREPSQHRLFGLPNDTGLSTLFLARDVALDSLLRRAIPTGTDDLVALTSGPLPPNPAELLASARMGEVIDELKERADVVIFDSPPLLGLADASALAVKVDGVVLVVDATRTRQSMLTDAIESLPQAQANLWGVVLNKVVRRRAGSYSQYGRDRETGSYTGRTAKETNAPSRTFGDVSLSRLWRRPRGASPSHRSVGEGGE